MTDTNKEREADALIRKLRDILEEARTYIGALTFSPSMDRDAADAVEMADDYLAGRASLSAEAEPVAEVVPCHTPSGKRVALRSEAQTLPIGTKLYLAAPAQAPAPDYDHGPQSATVEEAARHVGKWLNERPNRPLDLRDVAMLVAHAQAPARGWQDIATAPKDQPILVGPTKRMDICVAMNHSRDGWVTETCSEWVSIYTPTHWMPLPAAPSSGKGG